MMEKKMGKPGLAVLIAMKARKGRKDEEPDMSVEAAREILDAIKADDEQAFASLLKDFVHACVDGVDEDEEDGEEKPY